MVVMVMVFFELYARYFDADIAEARTGITVDAYDVLGTGRAGGGAVVVCFGFDGCESEPAHFCYWGGDARS
jgi:hypothetical protein